MTETLLTPLSPSECIKSFIEAELDPELGAAFTAGAVTDEETEQGVVAVSDSGMPKVETNAPLLWQRLQIRCVARSSDGADVLARAVLALMNQRGRTIIEQPSSGERWLMHQSMVVTGPAMRKPSAEAFESLMFLSTTWGTDPVPEEA